MKRQSGILLHITSLPSDFGIGDMGPGAYWFADFLAETKQGLWQILPLNPTDPACGHSPYSSNSAFAANKLLISPQLLVENGLLTAEELQPVPAFPSDRVNFADAIAYKERILQSAYMNSKKTNKDEKSYKDFCRSNAFWLDDYALFIALKEHFNGQAWFQWPKEIKDRKAKALEQCRKEFEERMDKAKFFQYIFARQWMKLKKYCNEKGIQFLGDLPIYVSYDSVDVWVNSNLFKLDKEKKPRFVSGVPPDYFSKTGQLWGNPVYDWNKLKKTNFAWWLQRLEHNLKLFNIVRIDHFRGLVGFWQVPAGETTAINGKWVKVPVKDFFAAILERFPKLPIIAEDLGIITRDVKRVMKDYNLPGMKVLLFAFGEDLIKHPYLPHRYKNPCVVYTGTHDNNTIHGWFEQEATPLAKENLAKYLKKDLNIAELHWDLIELAMKSKADVAIIPVQDVLGLGKEDRMNTPGTMNGNWSWRLSRERIDHQVTRRLKETTSVSKRG